MKLRQAVLAIFINGENRVLIGSSPRDGGYKFPQGGIDHGESPEQGLARELKEELGIILNTSDVIKRIEQRVSYNYPANEPLRGRYTGQEFYVFKIVFRESMNPVPQDDEFDQLLWVKPGDLKFYETHHRKEAYTNALLYCDLL
jgi:putative (di)nucleoside polyphosphate hydrolase